MAPLIPRLHLFEIDDQPWYVNSFPLRSLYAFAGAANITAPRFPPFLRARVQDALQALWNNSTPYIQPSSPARLAASLLYRTLGRSTSDYTFIDFCAGSGGPTPAIERSVNHRLRAAALPEVDFVLTDLHPNPEAWARAATKSDHIRYESSPVDASAADAALVARLADRGPLHGLRRRKGQEDRRPKTFRLFNLAFHHFDDPLASAIMKNTLETSDGFAIFELQARDFASLLGPLLFGIGLILLAPYHAWRLRSWEVIVFTYLIPILPFVLTFDGWVSALRTRTPDEVKQLIANCGADSSGWEVKSGIQCHLWPVGYMNWIIATKTPPK
ncbi:hypothetical protein F5X68DRAFT_234323 [Plectosphaerella plurivora]|uniref:Class I SAM-dependent methyltransferase n=1 Tax=Plectosphaerella plurivora TaxID=936078 RepID=A0A9P8V7Z3_9PEZI|nr:hypothetical protein F5X68DRAFT_234323 [Plectosphaerella plurivora]